MGMAHVKICPNGTVGNRCGCADGEGCRDNAALVAAYERGVAEGRRQAAENLFEMLRAAGIYAVHTPDGRLYHLADVAFAVSTAARIAEGAPAEPVEESARRIQADVIRQAIAAIATLGPISGERWMAELERFAQIVEESDG